MDKIKLSQEEMLIINQVKKDVHYYRCFPLSLGCVAGCHFLMRRGMISTSKPFMKYAIFGLGGYIIGTFSFPAMMKTRMLNEVPDGNFAQTYRKLQHMSSEERQEFLKNARSEIEESIKSQQSTNQTQSLPIQQDNTLNTSIFTPANQSQQSETTSETSDVSQKQFSYREQRSRQNTDNKYRQPTDTLSGDDKISSNKNVHRNKYGDEME